ncbi:MAG: efflux RND transporter periplasmic adaptor subunit [Nibricoccus sp.]
MKSATLKSPPDLAAIVQSAKPGRFRKLRTPLIVVIALLILLAGFLRNRARAAAEQGPSFATTPLSKGNIDLTITATGNLEPTNEVTIGSELSGTILEVYVDINDHVTKGQPLAKLDTTKLSQETDAKRASLKIAEAAVAQATATVKQTEATLKRAQDLRQLSNGRLPSQADLDTAEAAADRAKADLLSAESNVAQAKANLVANETDLAKAIIRSPLDGMILTRDVEPGQTVQASYAAPELFVVAENLEHMKLVVTVAEADIGRLTAGQNSTFTVDAWPDRTYTAKVLRVSYGSSVTNNVVTYKTELEVSNSDLTLRPGMTATADIHVATSKDVFLVPTAALRFDPEKSLAAPAASTAQKKSFIQSLTPMPPRRQSGRPEGETAKKSSAESASRSRIWALRDGHPEPISVKLGLSDGSHTEVTGEGLSADLPVITSVSTPPAR